MQTQCRGHCYIGQGTASWGNARAGSNAGNQDRQSGHTLLFGDPGEHLGEVPLEPGDPLGEVPALRRGEPGEPRDLTTGVPARMGQWRFMGPGHMA